MRAALRACWVLARGRPAALTLSTTLALVERLAVLASAAAWGSGWFVWSLVGLGALAAVNRGLRMLLRTRFTAATFGWVVERVLRDDVDLGDTAALPVVDAVHNAVRGVVDLALPGAADATAAMIGLIWLAWRSSTGIWILPVGAMAVAVGIGAGKLFVRPSDTSFNAYVTILERFADAFDGSVEVRASGHGMIFNRRASEDIDRWRALAIGADLRAAVLARVPLVLAAGVLVVASVMHRAIPSGADLLLLAAVLPPGLGAVRSAQEIYRLRSRLVPLAPLLVATNSDTSLATRKVERVASVTWEHVTFGYGDHTVLANVTIAARAGEILALCGPNGAGKTTLLCLALGLRRATRGRVLVGEDDLAEVEVAHWRRSTRYLSQRPYLVPRRNVLAALAFPETDIDESAARAALRRVNLWDRLETIGPDALRTPTDALSAGERQRLALARVLVRDARAYFLDEPDANLDAQGVAMVARIARELADQGKVVVVAAHTPDLIAAADRVVHLEQGRVSRIEDRRAPSSLATSQAGD